MVWIFRWVTTGVVASIALNLFIAPSTVSDNFAVVGHAAAVVLKLTTVNGEVLRLMHKIPAAIRAVSKVVVSVGAAAGNRVFYFAGSMACVTVMIAVLMSDVIVNKG